MDGFRGFKGFSVLRLLFFRDLGVEDFSIGGFWGLGLLKGLGVLEGLVILGGG